MSNLVKCPHCTSEFPLDQVMSAQLAESIRHDLETELSQKTQKLVAERGQLAKLQQELQTRGEQLDEQVRQALATERQKIEAKARAQAEQVLAVELKDRDEQLKQAAQQLDAFRKQELQLRRKARELDEQAQQQELVLQRRLDEERKKVQEVAFKQAESQFALKQAEAELTIKGLARQLEDARRKAEQGSQQTQGEVLELALENLLAQEFPGDAIEPVAKGARGGDVIQRVFDHSGRECGAILWESKRTKNWSDKWLSKAIDDQQEAKATYACIVSTALPETIQHFGDVNGVWIASWQCARGAALAMRRMLIEASRARTAAEGLQGKAEQVYQYLVGPEFYNRFRGVFEPCVEMQTDLESEKRAFQRQWNKRQKQIDRAWNSAAGLIGDLEGITGNRLREVKGMDLLALVEEEVEGAIAPSE